MASNKFRKALSQKKAEHERIFRASCHSNHAVGEVTR